MFLAAAKKMHVIGIAHYWIFLKITLMNWNHCLIKVMQALNDRLAYNGELFIFYARIKRSLRFFLQKSDCNIRIAFDNYYNL